MLAVQTVLDVDETTRECRIVAVETEDRVVAFVGRAARGNLIRARPNAGTVFV